MENELQRPINPVLNSRRTEQTDGRDKITDEGTDGKFPQL